MTHSLNRLSVTFLLSLLAVHASAIEICQYSDTIAECEAKIDALAASPYAATLVEPDSETIAKVEDSGAKRLLAKLYPELAALPGAVGGFEDFLSRFRIGVEPVDLEGQGDEALALEFTDFFGLDTEDGYKVQAVLLASTVFEPLQELLSEDQQDSSEKKLGSFDNVLVRATYSPTTERLGRSLVSQTAEISAILDSVADRRSKATTVRGELRRAVVQRFPHLKTDGEFTGKFSDIPDEDLRIRLKEAVELAQLVAWAKSKALGALLHQQKFFQVADLVSNQPQLNVTFSGTLRDDLVGPQEYGAKVTYEHGFTNLNKYRKHRDSRCKTEDALTCLANYLTPARQASLKKGDRVSFSVEWTKLDSYESPIEGVTLSREGSERWSGALSYGRFIRFDKDGNGVARFEATIEGQDWSDDPDRQNRLLGRLSLSQKISDDLAATIGIVWANKPEFFPDEDFDKEWSARIGLSYRLVSTRKDE